MWVPSAPGRVRVPSVRRPQHAALGSQVPRYVPTGEVCAGPSLDRNDGGNSTGRDQTTTPIGRVKTHYRPPQERRASPQGEARTARQPQGKTMDNKYDAHCRRPGCNCDHTICYQGWRDQDYSTTPCAYCRVQTFERWHARENARSKGYPLEALGRIMRGDRTTPPTPTHTYTPKA